MLEIPSIQTQDCILIPGCIVDEISISVTPDSELKRSGNILKKITGKNIKLEIFGPGNPELLK